MSGISEEKVADFCRIPKQNLSDDDEDVPKGEEDSSILSTIPYHRAQNSKKNLITSISLTKIDFIWTRSNRVDLNRFIFSKDNL